MIHEDAIKEHIHARYYAKKGIVLETRAAGKKFIQDRHIDLAIIEQIADEVHAEWKDILNQEKLKTKK